MKRLSLVLLALLILAMTGFVVAQTIYPIYTHGELAWRHFPPWKQSATNPPPPCLMLPPQNLYLTVITNSVDPFNLLGSSGLYVISQNPTNGYLTNLNAVTGSVTYVETNNAATQDFFDYCTSNAPTCMLCAPTYINIIPSTEVTCGQCFNLPPTIGGAVTGTIYFNTGVANEDVCVSYTNASCQNTTNCAFTDSFGKVSFFVSMCPSSSNFCIVSLQTNCSGWCAFDQAYIAGTTTSAGAVNFNGMYFVQMIVGNQETLTNGTPSPFGLGPTIMFYYPFGFDDLALGFPQYAILWEPSLSDAAMYTTNPINCSTGAFTPWTLTAEGSNFYTIPTTSYATNILQVTNCTPICP